MIRQLTIGGATAALALAVLVVVSSQEKTLGQQATATQGRRLRVQPVPSVQPMQVPIRMMHADPHDKVSAAQRKLIEADTDEGRQAAEKELRDALVAEFDADMQRRAEELESIRKRVADMEANLEKRTAAKDEIIDLRLEVLIQDAEGLGWTAERRGRTSRDAWAAPIHAPQAIIHQVRPPGRLRDADE